MLARILDELRRPYAYPPTPGWRELMARDLTPNGPAWWPVGYIRSIEIQEPIGGRWRPRAMTGYELFTRNKVQQLLGKGWLDVC